MTLSEIKNLVKDCLKDYVLLENLLLKRHEGKLVVVSDETDRKKQSAETFRNKDKLKAAGFRWDGHINSWTIDQTQLKKAQEILSGINKTPMERFIDKVEELPEFLQNTDNLSKKDELSQKIDKFVDELSTAVDATAVSDTIKKFLAFNAKFRGYSFHNTLLIYLQRPDARRVAGFKQWEEKFFRRVKKGAKGISILAPIRKKVEEPATAGVAPTPVGAMGTTTTAAGDEKEVDKEKRSYLRFMAVTVFDISDTEAIDERGNIEEPQWHGSNEPNAKADELYQVALELAETMGVKVDTTDKLGRAQGSAAGDHINIASSIAGVNRAATVIHEIAHELLHFKKSSPFYIGDEEKKGITREMEELQAESVSFIVLKYYELPAEHQATYLALWKANKDSIRSNLTTIKKAADFIIGELDKIQDEKVKQSAATTVTESGFEQRSQAAFDRAQRAYDAKLPPEDDIDEDKFDWHYFNVRMKQLGWEHFTEKIKNNERHYYRKVSNPEVNIHVYDYKGELYFYLWSDSLDLGNEEQSVDTNNKRESDLADEVVANVENLLKAVM